MLEKAIKLKGALKLAGNGSEPNYLFLGDLNTLGMNYKFSKFDILQSEELDRLDRY